MGINFWTKDEVDTFFDLRKKGWSYYNIASRLGKSEKAVKNFHARYMARGRKPKLNVTKKDTLCWVCRNAVPNPETGDGCEWSRSVCKRPVEGWEVEPGTTRVITCPEFKQD